MRNLAKEIERGAAWLEDYFSHAGVRRMIIGLSGGVDSATVALWAARALGPRYLTLLSMPYGLKKDGSADTCLLTRSHPDSVRHATQVADILQDADFRILPITETVDTEVESGGYDNKYHSVANANLKARVRAVRLRTFSNCLNGIVLGTENKTEHELGYFTLGGDEESDLELLSSYYKTEVWELAKLLGVPSEIVSKPPSADLWEGQTDEGEFGFSYPVADMVLKDLDRGLPNNLVAAVHRQRAKTQHKRGPKAMFNPRPIFAGLKL